MKQETAARIERSLALLLLLWAAALHATAALSAGALWRDEANSIQQARLPSWNALWQSLEYDSFPILYPSLLRVWSSGSWTADDQGLRMFGLLTGLALLGVLFFAARRLGTRWPVVVLVLLAGNAVLISEGDSIRPYGVSLLLLVWAYAGFGAALARPCPGTLAAATFASVLCVQASYTNALWVGVFCLSAARAGAAGEGRRLLWRFFVPGIGAALSLLPYTKVLLRAGAWAALLKQRVDWLPLLRRLAESHALLPVLCGLAFGGLAAARILGRTSVRRSPVFVYELWVLVLSLAVQTAFVMAAGITPFPRYFLPLALFAAFAIEAALDGWRPGLRLAATAAALFLCAWPAWSWLRMRHTNVDEVAGLLAQRAVPRDLVVVSPWFLNTSFQRYYRGPCPWITVPDLERQPLMRYDLLRRAMADFDPENGAARRLQAALERGGTIWFVSQKPWTDFARAQAPEVPRPARAPGGADYVRFRSYWERDIEHLLYACCAPPKVISGAEDRVWREEELILSGWQKKQH